MAKFLFWSDLHREFGAFDMPDPRALPDRIDAVLLGGDTDTGRSLMHLDFAAAAARRYGVPVAMVLGNHEYYGCEYHDLRDRQAARLAELSAEGLDIRVLDATETVIAGTRIVGATLWTDFELDPSGRVAAERAMNDYRLIAIDEGHGPRRLRAADTIALHDREKAAILDILATPFAGPTLVMTHHMPLKELVHPAFAGNAVNGAFTSDLGVEISGLDFRAWILRPFPPDRRDHAPGRATLRLECQGLSRGTRALRPAADHRGVIRSRPDRRTEKFISAHRQLWRPRFPTQHFLSFDPRIGFGSLHRDPSPSCPRNGPNGPGPDARRRKNSGFPGVVDRGHLQKKRDLKDQQ